MVRLLSVPNTPLRQWLQSKQDQPATNHEYFRLVENLTGLEPHLSSKIKGQAHVIPRVCSVLERGQFGLQPTGKPLGSFLFLGPTGVGKTKLTLEFIALPFR